MTIERRPGAEPAPEELATSVPHRPSLWRQGDFMKLWTGQTISQFGDEITGLAIPLLATLILGAQALEMGILGVVRFLPWILFTLPAGVWVDRMRRRPILIGADLARAVLLTSIPIAFLGGWLTLIQVYVVAFLAGTFEVFFDVAYQSFLPSIVERDELVEGNSKLELSRAASQVAGPTVAGFLIQAIQAPFAILFDAASYLIAALFVGLIRREEAGPEPHDPATGERPSMWQEARAGVGYVFSNRYLRSIAATTGTANLFSNMSGAVLILYLVNEDALGLTPGAIGIIFALGNLGVIVGALTGGRLAKGLGIGPTIVISAAVSGLATFAVPLAPQDDPFWYLVIGGLILGFGVVVYNVNQVGLRQAITPDRMLGRMNATMRLIVWGTIPIGALIGGILGTVFGLVPVLWVSAIGASLSFLPVLFSPVRSLREIPAQAE
jgi:MFS family permease